VHSPTTIVRAASQQMIGLTTICIYVTISTANSFILYGFRWNMLRYKPFVSKPLLWTAWTIRSFNNEEAKLIFMIHRLISIHLSKKDTMIHLFNTFYYYSNLLIKVSAHFFMWLIIYKHHSVCIMKLMSCESHHVIFTITCLKFNFYDFHGIWIRLTYEFRHMRLFAWFSVALWQRTGSLLV
jgi:hypothetical protein